VLRKGVEAGTVVTVLALVAAARLDRGVNVSHSIQAAVIALGCFAALVFIVNCVRAPFLLSRAGATAAGDSARELQHTIEAALRERDIAHERAVAAERALDDRNARRAQALATATGWSGAFTELERVRASGDALGQTLQSAQNPLLAGSPGYANHDLIASCDDWSAKACTAVDQTPPDLRFAFHGAVSAPTGRPGPPESVPVELGLVLTTWLAALEVVLRALPERIATMDETARRF
jgi:hypothetical protein